MLKGYYQIIVKNRAGRVIHRRRQRELHSYLIAFLQILHVQMAWASTSIKDTGGVNRSVTKSDYNFYAKGPSGNITYGIVVGTDDTPVANDDYQLGAIIVNGAGAGQLAYGDQSFIPAVEFGLNVDLITSRPFTNNSPGDILVKEIGVYNTITPLYFAAGIRDVLDAPENVEPGQTLTVIYTLRTSA